jgi:aryl-alcohol dehydrogenase-like predicted oxidoreductase
MAQAPSGRLRIEGTALEIGRLGFGCARLFAGAELRQSAKLIEEALSGGVRHFDTAPAYGQSEDVLGSVLAGVQDVTVATKVGIPRPSETTRSSSFLYRRALRPVLSRVPSLKSALLRVAARGVTSAEQSSSQAQRRVLSREEILSSLEESLRRLRRDTVDIFFVHEPDQLLVDDKVVEVITGLLRERIIGAFGLALDRAAAGTIVIGSVLQARYDARLDGANMSDASGVGATRIFHGVMRHAVGETGPRLQPSMRVRRLLERERGVGVLFSASAPFQIREVCRACAGL